MISVSVASHTNGANTSSGNHSGQSPALPARDAERAGEEAERNRADVAQEEPRRVEVEARGTPALPPRRSRRTAARAGRRPATKAASEQAPNPNTAMPPARPSEPSMKLYRFALQASASASSEGADGRPRTDRARARRPPRRGAAPGARAWAARPGRRRRKRRRAAAAAPSTAGRPGQASAQAAPIPSAIAMPPVRGTGA